MKTFMSVLARTAPHAFQGCGAKFQMRTHIWLLQLDQHCCMV